jgi:hypothetical protein
MKRDLGSEVIGVAATAIDDIVGDETRMRFHWLDAFLIHAMMYIYGDPD